MNQPHDPLLSVIVASRNYQAYIAECLDSLLRQTYRNLEIVICDDASSDDTPSIIRRYARNNPGRIKAIFKQESSGVARTRHEAIINASGTYLTTLDSDDYLLNAQKLQLEMALLFEQEQRLGRDVITFSNIVWVNGQKERLGIWGNPDTLAEGMILDKILCRSHMIPRDYVMKRALYDQVGKYDPDCVPYEDWDLKIRLASRHPFFYTGVEGTAYRQHGQGLSSIPIPAHIAKMRSIFNRHITLIEEELSRQSTIQHFETFITELEKKIPTFPSERTS